MSKNAEQRRLGIGEIAQRRLMGTLEILRLHSIEVFSEQSGNWSVRVNENETSPTRHQKAADRSRHSRKILYMSGIDQLRSRQQPFYGPQTEHKRIGAIGRHAPQAQTAVARMFQEKLVLGSTGQ